MQKLFYSLQESDKLAEKKFLLGNGLLMENAARGSFEKLKEIVFNNQEKYLLNKFCGENKKRLKLQIVCGSGDNGGDGLALARMCSDFFDLSVVCIKEPKSELCKLQQMRLNAVGINIKKNIENECDILFDAFLGTGLKGELNSDDKKIINDLNKINCIKIACDIPSGLNLDGNPMPVAVKADFTFSMGALKTAFFSDAAKDFIGRHFVIDLGIPRSKYEQNTDTFLLEKNDMLLPIRKKQNSHKGSFGHAAIISGEKSGACLLAAAAAMKFGAGLLTICGTFPKGMQFDFMYSENFSANKFTAAAIGSGLGKTQQNTSCGFSILLNRQVQQMPLVLDADIFYYEELKNILPKLKCAVLTPHPKEFVHLLKICGLGNFSVQEIQNNRLKFIKEIYTKYPNLTIILKGANPIIASNGNFFINEYGTPALSKAGSGDVLTGMITALLAQGYNAEKAAVTASLAHSIAALYGKNNFSLTASELILNLSKL